MKVITGYLYHIKDEFFDKINAKSVMINHKNGHSRPSYLAIKDGKILWFIPLSSKIQKYQKIVNRKIKKYKRQKFNWDIYNSCINIWIHRNIYIF